MLLQTLRQLYRRLRLTSYRRIFGSIRERSGSLSATEAFSADVIQLMGAPTLSQFAQYLGISQPNATYKVNQLTAKGYLEKHVQARDRREVVLTTSEKFTGYFDEDKEDALQQKIRTAAAQFTPAELDSAERVLLALEALIDLYAFGRYQPGWSVIAAAAGLVAAVFLLIVRLRPRLREELGRRLHT